MGEGVRGWLAYVPPNGAAAFGLASLLGAFTIVLMAHLYVFLVEGGLGYTGLEAVVVACTNLPIFTLLLTPFVAFGLAVFGVPAAYLLRPYRMSGLIFPVVMAWGFIAAILTLSLYENWLFWEPEYSGPHFVDVWMGFIGLPPAFWAWLLFRRVLFARAAQEVAA